MNIDGTLLCESCAWDLPEAPVPVAVAPPAVSVFAASAASGSIDVVPLGLDAPAALPMEAAPMAEEMAAPPAVPVAEFTEEPFVDEPPPPAAPKSPTAVYPPPPAAVVPPPVAVVEPPVAVVPPPPPAYVPPPPPAYVPPPPPPPPPVRPPSPRVSSLAPGVRPRLVVVRGLKANIEYPIYDGPNVIGRSDDAPADIDLLDQEASNRVFASRQHACITWDNGKMFVEDLNSANGTFVNKQRLEPHIKQPLRNGDFVQTGTVLFKVNY